MDAAVLKLIEEEEISAIALDTEVFDSKGLALESGLLLRMGQFADSSIAVLLPDVIVNEVEAHLIAAANDAQGQLKHAMKELRRARLLPASRDNSPATKLLEEVMKQAVAMKVVKERMAGWITRTKAAVLPVGEFVTLDEVMQRYFRAEPPFAVTGGKKHEFPDATALLTLERWAEQNDCKVLVVSNDGDWARYCATSQRLFLVKDLADAMSGFQDEAARYAARRLGELLDEGDPVSLRTAVLDALQIQGDNFDFFVNADSQFEFEHDTVEAFFTDVDLPSSDSAVEDFEAVDYGDETVFVRVVLPARAEVHSYFTFQKWDSIDREYLSMGSGEVITVEAVDVEAIVTLNIKNLDRMKIESVEILPGMRYITLNDIEPDWMNEPENYGGGEGE